MPSVMDMVEIMERLESKSLHVDPPHCVRVRNRNATCSKCVDMCPSGAITLQNNTLSIDSELCMSCGGCATVCPTSAIQFLEPTDEELAASIDASAEALDGNAVLVCARMKAKHIADVDLVANVPCVSRIGVETLVGACARGASKVTVIDAVCSTCKYRHATRRFDDTVREAQELLALWGSDAVIERVQDVPEAAQAQSVEQSTGGVSRRGFFTQARTSAKTVAAEAVSVTVEKELGIKRDEKSLRSMLKVDVATGSMPRIEPHAHDTLLEDLYGLGEPAPGRSIETTQWGSVIVDESACVMCGMCATFCPTGALTKVFAEGKKRPVLDSIEYRLADCVQCKLCADACVHKAITVDNTVDCDLILEFEPREIHGTKKENKRLFFK